MDPVEPTSPPALVACACVAENLTAPCGHCWHDTCEDCGHCAGGGDCKDPCLT